MNYLVACNATLCGKQLYSGKLGMQTYGVAVFINIHTGAKYCLIKWVK